MKFKTINNVYFFMHWREYSSLKFICIGYVGYACMYRVQVDSETLRIIHMAK